MKEAADDLLDRMPLAGMRQVIARNMVQSLREMAQLTLHRRIDASPLMAFRDTFSVRDRPSVNDVLLAAVARTLRRHPSLNATLEDETIYRWKHVHLGMATAIEGGLVVPVIRNAETLPLATLRSETAKLSELARRGALTMGDLAAATFTVSNLGTLGIDGFTPIVNPPQVAILGVGRIDRSDLTLSLTIDHRALDGAPGALFLQDLAEVLADPKSALS
jgi:pyruvate dehydrogenase E2 component (dihydrolipoamide acetyltransferase)